MSKIRVVVMDGAGAHEKIIDNGLESLQKEIGCQIIDIQERKVGKYWLQFVVDDEGLLKELPEVRGVSKSALPDGTREILVGNIVICSHKGRDLTGLTDKQVKAIMQSKVFNLVAGDTTFNYQECQVLFKAGSCGIVYDF